jgi:hypothetical protein
MVSGNRVRPSSVKTSSISGGISPARSLAVKMAWPARARSIRRHSSSSNFLTPMRARYGSGWAPMTSATTRLVERDMLMTWPVRA